MTKLYLLKKEIGLNYTLDALQNISPSQADVEDNILYQRRYQTGIEWNILKDGFIDNRSKMKALDNQQLLEREINSYKNLRQQNNSKMNLCIFWFNQYKLD